MSEPKPPEPTKDRLFSVKELIKIQAMLMLDSHIAARRAELVVMSYIGLLERLDATGKHEDALKATRGITDPMQPLRRRWTEFTPIQQAAVKAEIRRIQDSYERSRYATQKAMGECWGFIGSVVDQIGRTAE